MIIQNVLSILQSPFMQTGSANQRPNTPCIRLWIDVTCRGLENSYMRLYYLSGTEIIFLSYCKSFIKRHFKMASRGLFLAFLFLVEFENKNVRLGRFLKRWHIVLRCTICGPLGLLFFSDNKTFRQSIRF